MQWALWETVGAITVTLLEQTASSSRTMPIRQVAAPCSGIWASFAVPGCTCLTFSASESYRRNLTFFSESNFDVELGLAHLHTAHNYCRLAVV